MSTLSELQGLRDYEFHQLCDALLRRVEPRYAALTPHGINADGKSIRGQPDSYVGNSPSNCRIAFEYSTQVEGWWRKIISDVKVTVGACPSAEEIVIATPRDTNREGPIRGVPDWLGDATIGAGKASLTIYNGPRLALLLDSDHQDLRYEYLSIPYSRLCRAGLTASSREVSSRTVCELQESGRYEPDRYVSRAADRDLFRLWQRACAKRGGFSTDENQIRLVPLVNDSGVGKTSLLCKFVEAHSPSLPVLFVEARNLGFVGEASLVDHVIQALQGGLDPSIRRHEEAAIVHCLNEQTTFTVVVDGLDESPDPDSVSRAISFWLSSRLGQMSLLIVSSRPEFWRICGNDPRWDRWMPGSSGSDRQALTTDDRATRSLLVPRLGVRLPDLFTESELDQAWRLAGQTPEALFALDSDIREELRHPFTLRTYLEVMSASSANRRLGTRAEILEEWLNRRLTLETDESARMEPSVYRKALSVVAAKIDESSTGSVSVDDLQDAPRFDRTQPPGPVVQKLISSNLLETMPGDAGRIRFTFAAIHDYFIAENEYARISTDTTEATLSRFDSSLTKDYTRLSQIGRRIASETCRHEFVSGLAARDPAKAAVVLAAKPNAYEPSVRKQVVEGLCREMENRHKARSILGVELLGKLDCPEAHASLLDRLLPSEKCPPHLKLAGGTAVAKLGLIDGLELTYGISWFGSPGTAWYTRELLSLLRDANFPFKLALGNHALSAVQAGSGTVQHRRAVSVLAHLADDRLAGHLQDRLDANGILQDYENKALVAVGSRTAAEVFIQSLRLVASRLNEIPIEREHGLARHRWK